MAQKDFEFKHDKKQASQHLELLSRKPVKKTNFIFAAYDESKTTKRNPFQCYGTLDERWDQLIKYNMNGYGIYVTVNQPKGTRRRKADMDFPRAIWRELDEDPPLNPELEPSFILVTSPGKMHEYYLIEEDEYKWDEDRWLEWDDAMHCSVNKFGSDNNAKDRSRVLRLAGTYHRKAEPFFVAIKKVSLAYNTWDVVKAEFAMGADVVEIGTGFAEQAKKAAEAETQRLSKYSYVQVETILESIELVDIEEGYKIWVEVGMALKNWKNTPESFELWDTWSKTDPERYKDKECKYQWDKFKLDGGITIGTLVHYARQAGWEEYGMDLVEQYLYVQSSNKYLDIRSMTLIPVESFRAVNLRDYPGGKGNNPAADRAFHFHPRSGECIVDELGWWPGKELIYELDHTFYANTYLPVKMKPETGSVKIWMDMVKYLVPVAEYKEVLLDWMAFTLQRPEQKINWQILMWGTPRIGKDTIFYPLRKIFGTASSVIPTELHDSAWGDMWFRKKFVVVSEVFQGGRREFENKLKLYAAGTEELIPLNMKGRSITYQPNLYSMVLFSNHSDAMHLSEKDARYFVLACEEDPRSAEYYKNIWDWYSADKGVEKVFKYLLERNIKDFSYGVLPIKTEAYRQMIDDSQPPWHECLETMCVDKDGPMRPLFCLEPLLSYIQNAPNGWIKLTSKTLATRLKEIGYVQLGFCQKKGEGGKRLWCHADKLEKYYAMPKGKLFELFMKQK